MAYAINDTCISCGACEGGCPVGAISMGDEHMMIDAGTCIDCGSCADTPCTAIAAPNRATSRINRFFMLRSLYATKILVKIKLKI